MDLNGWYPKDSSMWKLMFGYVSQLWDSISWSKIEIIVAFGTSDGLSIMVNIIQKWDNKQLHAHKM
jgi:HKD family nuclease